MVIGGIFMSKLQFSQKESEDNYRDSNALLSDIIINYRTIISFGEKNVRFILSKYNKLLLGPNRRGILKAHISGIFFGYSQFIRFAFVALVFWIAAILVDRYNLN